MALIERKLPNRKFVEFPQMKGRIVERIEVFTMSSTHSLTIYFQDKTFLNLLIQPCLSISPRFSDGTGDEKASSAGLPSAALLRRTEQKLQGRFRRTPKPFTTEDAKIAEKTKAAHVLAFGTSKLVP